MRRVMMWAVVGMLAAASGGRADDPVTPASVYFNPSMVADFAPPTSPTAIPYLNALPPSVVPPPTLPPLTEPFAQATEAGGQPSRSFNENFDGDFPGLIYTQNVVTGFNTVPRVVGTAPQVTGFTQQVTVTPGGARTVTSVPVVVNAPVIVQDRVPVVQTVRVPLATRYNGVSVVEFGNPITVDQAYLGYNFYSNVGQRLNPGVGGSDVYRQTAGFEHRILGGDASVGIRVPLVQQYGPLGLSTQNVGDLTVLFKYLFYGNPQTGNVISGGLAVTAPTGGGSAILPDGTTAPHSWLLQPWGGFVRRFDRAYVQGITNLIVPTDSRDVTLLGNSLGVGYWLYQAPTSRLLTGITPVAEVHVRTPLNHRTPADFVFFQDQVNLTTGAHFRFNRAVLSGAVVVPVVGPKLFSVEAIAYASYWF
jgi:hypothetical protein